MFDNKWGGFWLCTNKGNGPWVMKNPERLVDGNWHTKSHECVAIAQETMLMPRTFKWREGEKVFGGKLNINGENYDIPAGTVVATFINGLYPSKSHGNHVAIYYSQGANYIKVIDQWDSRHPNYRNIYVKEGMTDRSNNANAFSVVYTLP